MPGHYGEVCRQCDKDKYKNIVGTGSCFDCMNKPENGYYTSFGNDNSDCHYECNENLTSISLKDNCHCYSAFYFYINKIGGYPGVIGIALTLFFVLIIVMIRFFKKKKRIFRESIDKNENLFDDLNIEKGNLK